MSDYPSITYGRTFNLQGYESLKIEVQLLVGGENTQEIILMAAYHVLYAAKKEVTRIREARSKVQSSLGPEPIIDYELNQIAQLLNLPPINK